MTSTLTVGLAEQINSEHAACLKAANDALEHAMRCGELLAQAKAECDHGQWQDWLADNFAGSTRTAQVYMRLANNRDRLAKAQSPALLTIYEATRLISDSSLVLPADVEAKLAPIATTIRGLLEEMDDLDRDEQKTFLEVKQLIGDKVFSWAEQELGLTKDETKLKLRGCFWATLTKKGVA